MQALLDSLRKDLDALAAERARRQEAMKAAHRELSRAQRAYDKTLRAVVKIENQIHETREDIGG